MLLIPSGPHEHEQFLATERSATVKTPSCRSRHFFSACDGSTQTHTSHVDASQGMPTVSVQWGAWAGSGMAASDARLVAALARAGMGAVTARQGLLALSNVLSGGLGAGALSRMSIKFPSCAGPQSILSTRHQQSHTRPHIEQTH